MHAGFSKLRGRWPRELDKTHPGAKGSLREG
jgi:hypothetical protein